MSHDTTTPTSPMRVQAEDFARLVGALFDSRDHAEKARQDLIAAGIPGDDIVIAGADDGGVPGGQETQGGFWETLKELFMPDADRHSYDEGLRRGGFTISVRTDTATHDRVIDILDRDGAVDLDEREESWRNEGWTGYTARDPIVDGRSREPGLINSDEEEPSYTAPSNATAGFTASMADHFPIDEAPPVESPGALPESERMATPDTAYEAAAPGLSPNPGAPAVPSTADGAGAAGSRDAAGVNRGGVRDVSHGRVRVRSYLAGQPDDGDAGPSNRV